MICCRYLIQAVLLLFVFASPAFALLTNSIRVDEFKWMKIQTEHFDIYYAKGSEKLLPRMALYLESAWEEVGEKLNFPVQERTPFFFYSNHNEFEQTNIVPVGEGTGGVTEAFKNRFVIFNDGSEEWMKHVIYHEFAHVVQFNVLYGGFWKSIRLLKSPFYPLWVMEGMAEWVTEPIDGSLTDMMVRDSVYHGYRIPIPELQGFNHLKPNQVTLAYKTGTMAMAFLADEFGQETIGQLLAKMENHFDISAALDQLLGIDVYRLDYRFEEWLKDRYYGFFQNAKPAPHYGTQLTFTDGIPQANHALVFSKDGKKIYYFGDKRGPTQLYEYDVETKESEPRVGLKWSQFENIHSKGRALSISKDGRWLAFAAERKQRDFLYLYDLKKNKLKKIKVPFDQIRSPVFSPTSDQLVCVGMENGFNDLYLINRRGKILKRLTRSPQDEKDPVFTRDGLKVIYSGEVLDQTGSRPAGRDLFEIGIEDKTPKRITDLRGGVLEPETLPDGSILFVRDRNDKGEYGFNLYHWDQKTKAVTQLTNFVGGGFSPRFDDSSETLHFIAFDHGERQLYRWNSVEKNPLLASRSSSHRDDAEADDWGDPPRHTSSKAMTRALQAWPESSDSSLFLRNPRPYQFEMSTDLFLPFFFYSTQDGLVVADIWQFSDYLGNHQVQQQMQFASGSDFIDLAGFYTYARYRPQFTVGARTQRYYRDLNELRQRREVNAIGLVTYPLDRIKAVNLGVGGSDQKDLFFDDSEADIKLQERFWLTGFSYNTITGRYLVPTRGRRFSLFYQESVKKYGSNAQYRTGGVEGVQYISLPRESTFASRVFYGRSVGSEPQVFRLGGVDRIRGLSNRSLEFKKQNAVFASGEMRLRMQYLNARTKFLFPDFFFKASYLILFSDVGYGWDNAQERRDFETDRLINSSGAGISWPTFILQTFQINLTVLWSRRTDTGTDVWYITLGPSF